MVPNLLTDFSDTALLISNCDKLFHTLDSEENPLSDVTKASAGNLFSVLQDENNNLGLEDEHYTDIGELSFDLLGGLSDKAQQADQQVLFNDIIIAFAAWLARHNAVLKQIDLVVDAIANTANTCHDKAILESLYEAITYIIRAIDDKLKATSNPSDPWKFLNFNYAIVATRTHSPEWMESAFTTLLENFPDEAKGFFTQGMSQMERSDYPNQVKEVMQNYHEKYG